MENNAKNNIENSEALKKNLTVEKEKLSKKKIIIRIAVIVLAVVGIACFSMWYYESSENKRIEKINNNAPAWKESAVTEPEIGSLEAAGYVTIRWNSADVMGEVEGYKVYVNDELVAETDGETTTCEYYTTKVSAHKVYIEANLKKGSKINSNIFTFYVNKKGYCVNKEMAQNIDGIAWGGSWYYNWELNPFGYTTFQDLQYVPMMWGSFETDRKIISRFHKLGYKYVLAFNEPDRLDQADIPVDDAVEGMKAFMDQNLLVGSPATALCPPWSDNWFQPFMEKMEAQGMDVDFIPIHHYWNWWQSEGAEAFLELVKETYEMYHKPIWITEFAISGDPGDTEEQRQSVIDYMKIVVPGLDEMEFVERYAWFSFSPNDIRNGGSSLIQSYTGEITDLGYVYQELGMPEGYREDGIVRNEKNSKKDEIK